MNVLLSFKGSLPVDEVSTAGGYDTVRNKTSGKVLPPPLSIVVICKVTV